MLASNFHRYVIKKTKMLSLTAAYNDYTSKLGDESYHCDVGNITFYKSTREEICIYYIYVNENERCKGHFSSLINHIMKDPKVQKLAVLGCCKYNIEYALWRRGFTCKGGDFIWCRDQQHNMIIQTQGLVKNLENVTYKEYLMSLGIDPDFDS